MEETIEELSMKVNEKLIHITSLCKQIMSPTKVILKSQNKVLLNPLSLTEPIRNPATNKCLVLVGSISQNDYTALPPIRKGEIHKHYLENQYNIEHH
uniref:Uncharacterized protein MANES_16G101900 n=1 Tax=Rhizophora mucronata TaxID=61149 RepID=A0A2P2MPS9_RHIMU